MEHGVHVFAVSCTDDLVSGSLFVSFPSLHFFVSTIEAMIDFNESHPLVVVSTFVVPATNGPSDETGFSVHRLRQQYADADGWYHDPLP